VVLYLLNICVCLFQLMDGVVEGLAGFVFEKSGLGPYSGE
jgi:hypothetical protein